MRLTVFLVLIMLLSDSCGEKIFTGDVNCDECYTDKPENIDLEIKVTLSGEYPEVPLVIYRGDVEENQVEYVDTAYESPYYLSVPAGKRYSVKAKYEKDDATLYAIDGTKPKIKLVTDACDSECYVIEDATLDVSIKKNFLDY